MQRIERWSFSRIGDMACPLKCKLKYVDRIPEPERGEPPPGLKEWPNDRGSRVHNSAENYVRGDEPLPGELAGFREEMLVLRELYQSDPGLVQLEQPWTFDRNWDDGGEYKDFKWWCAVILDIFVRFSPEEALVVDHKTGKRAWNEVKHAEQMKFYAMATFLRYEQVQQVTTELFYCDENNLIRHVHRRNRIAQTVRKYTKIGENYTRERAAWPAKPGRSQCFFCPYKTGMIGKHGPEGLAICDRNLD